MKIGTIVATIFFSIWIFAAPVNAVVNPLETSNNKYGIHIVDENDLTDAIELVNSNGGEWGYITMVITENERDHAKWQRTFDQMRREKVIPVIRIATRPQDNSWKKPTEEDAQAWADFLDNLNWVVKNRYIILFNEPNHAPEWEGTLAPEEYARIARVFRDKLKEKSPDFFILPAGFDQAARTQGDTMDEVEYFKQMHAADPTIFTIFDGWSIHAYPNPNFSGSPHDNGRGSIRGYAWETKLLGEYGLPLNTPIFITETGWAHQEGRGSFLSSDLVATFYKDAYENAWNNPNIVMVSPFIFNYQAAPFIQFSWKRPGSTEYYPQYHAVHEIGKVAGQPAQEDGVKLVLDALPSKLMVDSLFFLPVKIKNIGQKIWTDNTTFTLKVMGATRTDQTIQVVIDKLEPFDEKIVNVAIKTPDQQGPVPVVFKLEQDGQEIIGEEVKKISVLEPTSIWGKTVLFIRRMIKDKSNV